MSYFFHRLESVTSNLRNSETVAHDIKQSYQLLRLVRDSIFGIVNLGGDIHRYICTIFPFITSFINYHIYHSLKDWLLNVVSIIIHIILCCTAQEHKKSATLQTVDCNRNLNFNRVFGHSEWQSPIKWSIEELQIKLHGSWSDTVERNKMKQNTTALKDSRNSYTTTLLRSCLLLEFLFMNSALLHPFKSNQNSTLK